MAGAHARQPRRAHAPAGREPHAAPGTAHDVADLSLASTGADRIAWAAEQMPVLAQIRERFERDQPLGGIRVAACLHVTAETANLIRTLLAGGASAALCSA